MPAETLQPELADEAEPTAIAEPFSAEEQAGLDACEAIVNRHGQATIEAVEQGKFDLKDA